MTTNDPRTERLEGELEQIYSEQIAMLIDRCDSFYEGKVYEAKSASAIFYTLLADHGGSQKSLLGQLGKKAEIKFLDSRQRHELTINSAKGAWPRTVMPFKAFRKDDLHDFHDWWGSQTFKLVFKDIEFTRQEIVEAIRHKEGGGHVDSLTLKKIAAVRRNRYGWQRSITENEDGSTQMYVGISLAKQPPPEDSNIKEISDYELACIIAISEEFLFSVTPEPMNRLRMHHPVLQRPYYLSEKESDICKEEIRGDLEKLDLLENLPAGGDMLIESQKKALKAKLEIGRLTSEDCDIRQGIAYNLKMFNIEWPPKKNDPK